METRDTYQAGQSADDSATPEKVIPLRQPWAQIEMDILTLGARCFSLAGTRCLLYLLRYTVGFHTMTVKLTVDEFCNGKRRKDGGRFDEGTDLSRPSVLSGLHELQRAHVIAITNEGHGRGTVATYELFPVECWQVERLSIGKKSLPINDEASIGKDSSPIAASNGKSSLPKRRIIGKKSLPHINIEVKDSSPKEIEDDANASAERDTAPATPEKPTRQKRKLSPEARERHNAEAAYVSDLCKRQLTALKCGKSPKPGEDRAGGHWYYTAGPDGAPADPEQVIALLRVVKQSPHYSGQYLTLQATIRYWPEWLLDPKNVRDSIAVERRKAEYARAAANGHKAQRPAGREQTYAKTGEDMAPKGWS